MRRWHTLVMSLAVVSAAARPLGTGQHPIAAAKEAYTNAEYERCVGVLETATIPDDQVATAREFQALCLLALGREADAARAVEDILRVQPLYKVAPSSTPRLIALVTRVKRSALPAIVRQRYAEAKQAYDNRRNREAADGFRTVIALLEDPALDADTVASLGGLKTVASGFLDLIAAATPPPTAAPPAPPVVKPPPLYGGTDPDVVAPEVIEQTLPRWVPDAVFARAGVTLQGMLEVIVDETGAVESARVVRRIHPDYDTRVVRAARQWKYRPARLKDGTAVKFRKVIEIILKPS